jgi:hypothetical protein
MRLSQYIFSCQTSSEENIMSKQNSTNQLERFSIACKMVGHAFVQSILQPKLVPVKITVVKGRRAMGYVPYRRSDS